MTGPEHYREAERWLAHAESTYLDTSGDAGPREDYATDAEWVDALEEGAEHHERALREAGVFAAMGQAHATLARVAAFTLAQPVAGLPEDHGYSQEEYDAWYSATEIGGR